MTLIRTRAIELQQSVTAPETNQQVGNYVGIMGP